jgi:hypothetical protein
MGSNDNSLIDSLRKIVSVANMAIDGNGYSDDTNDDRSEESTAKGVARLDLGCTVRQLPSRLLQSAAHTASIVNPANAPMYLPASYLPHKGVLDPLAIALLTSKYWGPTGRKLTVSFMEPTPRNLRDRILSHMNAWGARTSMSFVITNGIGDVRISREPGGYWSYVGTDVLHIPKNRQTMNLEAFTMNTPDSEFHRVVRHEAGHTLGFMHEHMRKALVARIDPQKAYDYFWQNDRWDKATVDQQVLTPLDEKSLMATPPDQTSIMCYQLPGSITYDGKPILGGTDINATDYAFAARLYPKKAALEAEPAGAAAAFQAPVDDDGDWDASEDVEVML